MTPIDPALVERMAALCRDLASWPLAYDPIVARARAMVAELPAPVDPDLVEAREIAWPYRPGVYGKADEPAWFAGRYDGVSVIKLALAALRRGKELARS